MKLLISSILVVSLALSAIAQFATFPGVTRNNQGGGNFIPSVAASADYTNGMINWLVGDGVTNNGSSIVTWLDQSGNNYHTPGETHTTPPVAYTSQLNGHTIVEFTNNTAQGCWLAMSNVFSPLVACDVFMVIRCWDDPPAGATEVIASIGAGDTRSFFPSQDGFINDCIGSTTLFRTVDPTPSLTSWRLYEVQATNNWWTNSLDTTRLWGTNNNTVGFNTTPKLGHDVRPRAFDLAELRFYTNVLTTSQRSSVEQALKTKYNLTGF